MAARRKPPVKKIKFEVTYSGIAGIGTVCFCIFLWMFLLGVWTGQSLLLPSAEPEISMVQNIDSIDTDTAELLHIEAQIRKKMQKSQ